jgi:hypothetical protein
LRHGLITQGANPKALVFFTALLPFVDSGRAIAPQIAILGISSIIEFTVLALYVAVCQRARGMVQRPGFATALNRAGGVLLIGAGAGLATTNRGRPVWAAWRAKRASRSRGRSPAAVRLRCPAARGTSPRLRTHPYEVARSAPRAVLVASAVLRTATGRLQGPYRTRRSRL